MISVMQADIKRAELMIQNLMYDKDTLKTALASAVKKKDELYKIVLEYKAALEKMNFKTLEVEQRLDEVGLVKQEIDKVRDQLIRRDEKIKALHRRNLTLEQLLEEQGMTSSARKKMYKQIQGDDRKHADNLEIAVDIMLQKVRKNQIFHKLFRNCIPCVNYFRDLIQNEEYQEAIVKVCKFAGELMKDEEILDFRDMSPGISDTQQSITSFNATSQALSSTRLYDDEEDDDTRINKLTKEIQSNMERSKEVLLNKSISLKLKIPITEESRIYEKREESPSKTPQNNRRQIKIVKRPGAKSAKILPKPSILKRTE